MSEFGKTRKGPEAPLIDMIEHNADIIEEDGSLLARYRCPKG